MAEYNKTVLTNDGIELMRKANAGKARFTITRVVGSSVILSNKSSEELKNITNLTDIKQTGTIKDIEGTALDNNTVMALKLTFDNRNLTSAYTLNTIGIFAKEEGKEEFLYAVSTAKNAEFFPSFSNKVLFYFDVLVYLVIGQADFVTVNVSPEKTEEKIKEIKNTLDTAVNNLQGLLYRNSTPITQADLHEGVDQDYVEEMGIRRIYNPDETDNPHRIKINEYENGENKEVDIDYGYVINLGPRNTRDSGKDDDSNYGSKIIIASDSSSNSANIYFQSKNTWKGYTDGWVKLLTSSDLNDVISTLDVITGEFAAVGSQITQLRTDTTPAMNLVTQIPLNYYNKAEIDKKILSAGSVKTVNNTKPDGNGNIFLNITSDLQNFTYNKADIDNKLNAKANTTDVNSKLDKKADKSAVDDLSGKAVKSVNNSKPDSVGNVNVKATIVRGYDIDKQTEKNTSADNIDTGAHLVDQLALSVFASRIKNDEQNVTNINNTLTSKINTNTTNITSNTNRIKTLESKETSHLSANETDALNYSKAHPGIPVFVAES